MTRGHGGDGLPRIDVRPGQVFRRQAGGSTEQQLLGFLPIILMFVVLYFLMIRPQMKRAKEHRQMSKREIRELKRELERLSRDVKRLH